MTLQQLVVLVTGGRDARGAGVALSGGVAGITVRDNLVVAPEGIRALNPTGEAPAFLISAVLRIEDNILWCERQAVNFRWHGRDIFWRRRFVAMNCSDAARVASPCLALRYPAPQCRSCETV